MQTIHSLPLCFSLVVGVRPAGTPGKHLHLLPAWCVSSCNEPLLLMEVTKVTENTQFVSMGKRQKNTHRKPQKLNPLILSVYRTTKPEFLNLSTIDIWDQIGLCGGRGQPHALVFSSIPGRYPLDASGTPLHTVVTIKKCLRHGQMSPTWMGRKLVRRGLHN